MNPIFEALQAYLKQLFSGVAVAFADFLVKWFKEHVLPKNEGFKSMAPQELRAQARQWVKDMLAEFGQILVTKGVVPIWLQGFLPSVENLVEQAIDKALDAAGL